MSISFKTEATAIDNKTVSGTNWGSASADRAPLRALAKSNKAEDVATAKPTAQNVAAAASEPFFWVCSRLREC